MSAATANSVATVLAAINNGDGKAASDLLPLIYAELRLMARRRLAHEPPGQTLQATALVHEAYLRLVGDADSHWQNRGHFFAAAAEAMRRILVERARKRQRIKHGGGRQRAALETIAPEAAEKPVDVLALDEVLDRLEAYDKRKSDVVKLRYFAGLTIAETAKTLGVSVATVKNDWSFARAWLHKELGAGRE